MRNLFTIKEFANMCNMEQLLKYDYKETLLTDMKSKIETTVEPPLATTS